MSSKVTRHAAKRVEERVSRKLKPNKVFNKALKQGRSLSEFYGDFREYLESKLHNYKHTDVKVYDNNVYVYNNKVMITVYPVPEKYRPIKDYMTRYRNSRDEYLKALYKYVDKNLVSIDVAVKDKINVVTALYIDDYFENFGVGISEIQSRKNAVETYLKRINSEQIA